MIYDKCVNRKNMLKFCSNSVYAEKGRKKSYSSSTIFVLLDVVHGS